MTPPPAPAEHLLRQYPDDDLLQHHRDRDEHQYPGDDILRAGGHQQPGHHRREHHDHG
jgi:hypothetical protein